jgi:hypothetical protein
MLLLPQPFGPTIAVTFESNVNTVRSGNDLNPHNSIRLIRMKNAPSRGERS